MTDDGWTVGAEVALRAHGEWRGFTTVAKRYKNGNVVLANDPKQQWRTYGDGQAVQTGDRVWRRKYAYLVTDKIRAEIDEAKETARRRARIVKAQKIVEGWHRRVSEVPMDLVDAILATEVKNP